MKKLKLWHVAIILFAVCLATYSNSLHNDFMIDDHGLLLQDTRMHNLKFLSYQFIPDLNKTLNIGGAINDVYYRPMAHVVPLLCYLLFQKDPFGYHLVNLILFFFVCISIFILIRLLFDDENFALLTSLLFAVHPINGMFVNYITADVYGVQMIVLLWAVITFILALDKRRSFVLYAMSCFCFIVALLCHETSMALPIYLICILVVLKKYSFKESFIKCIPYILLAIIFLVLRMKFASLETSVINKIISSDLSFFEFIAIFAKLILWYVSKFIFPEGIVLMWIAPITQKYIVLWNLIFLIFCCCTFFSYRLKKEYPKVALALLWFVIGLLPVSLACFFQIHYGLTIEPHWLFFASIGLFMLMAFLLLALRKFTKKLLYFSVIGVLLVTFICISRTYNRLWGDEKQYCRFWADQNPGFKAPFFYLASSYTKDGKYAQARKYLKESIEGTFIDWQVYANLGYIDSRAGNIEGAIRNYKKALIIFPQSVEANNGLGIAYLTKNELKLAEYAFLRTISFNPFFLEPRLNLAGVYKKQGEFERAEKLYHENLDIDPHHKESLLFLMDIYFLQNKSDEALAVANQILLNIDDFEMLVHCAGILASLNYPQTALDFYEKILRQNPKNKNVYLELGKFYGNYNLFDVAIETWEQGLKLFPNDEKLIALIRQARELKRDLEK